MVLINNMSENYTEFKPLFEFFYDNHNLYKIGERLHNHYILPTLLQLLHSSNRKVYDLFKKFYGLTDETIKDEEYSEDFLIGITVNKNDRKEENKNYIVYTEIKFLIRQKYSENVNNLMNDLNNIIDFGEFIECYSNFENYKKDGNLSIVERLIKLEVDTCKKIITTWKESLLYGNESKFCC